MLVQQPHGGLEVVTVHTEDLLFPPFIQLRASYPQSVCEREKSGMKLFSTEMK